MEEHISSVICYTESVTNCRSTMLLEYFGERNVANCTQCDYCIRNKEREITKTDWDKVVNESKTESDILVISQNTGISEHKVIEILRQIKDGN